MNLKNLRTLKLLEEIDKDCTLSQRDLAKALNISLGSVNLFIKRLIKRGYFSVTAIPKNRVKYILTPKGVEEKTRLAYEFIQYSFEFYRNTREKLQTLFQVLVQQGVRRIAFYGASDLAEIAYVSLQKTPIDIVAIVDDDKSGQILLGLPILASSCLATLLFDRILITHTDATMKVLELMVEKHIPSEKVVLLT